MKTQNDKISPAQFMFSVACFIQGSSLLTFSIHKSAKQEAWLSVIIGCLVSLPVIGLYVFLTSRYPGKGLFEINQIVLGRLVGKAFSLLYLLFFVSLAILNLDVLGNFVAGNLLPTTPMPIILAMFVFICAWAVGKGVKTLTSYGTMFVVITIVILLTTSALLIKYMRLDNLLPVFSLPVKNYMAGAHVTAMLPICEIMVFLMLTPNLTESGRAAWGFWTGAAIGALTLLFVVVNDTAILGAVASVVPTPTYTAILLINIGNVLTNMGVFYAILLMMLSFFKTSILLYAFFLGLKQLLNLKSYGFLLPTFSAIIVILSNAVFSSADEHAEWVNSGLAPTYSTFFLLVLPAMTIMVYFIRKIFREADNT